MKQILVLLVAAPIFASCQQKGTPDIKTLATDIDSVSYALGANIGESLKKQGAGELNFEIMMEAAEKAYAGDSNMILSGQEGIQYLNTFFQKKQMEVAEKTLQEGKAYQEENKKKPGVTVTASGLQYQVIQSGSGLSPKMGDSVLVNYSGRFIDGTEFDNSNKRGTAAKMKLGRVVPGWDEALQMMKEGDQWQLVVPSELGYGAMGGGKIPANSTLVFDIELVQVLPQKTN